MMAMKKTMRMKMTPTIRAGLACTSCAVNAICPGIETMMPTKISSEIGAARYDRIESLDNKLISDLGYLHRCGKPA